MIADLLTGLAKANLAGAAAVLAVLALRTPLRRALGARAAYALWLAVPACAAAVLAPHPSVGLISPEVIATAEAFVTMPAAAAAPKGIDWTALLAGLWAVGALAMLAWLALQQVRFTRAAKAGLAGPAVVGVLRPRIVTPADFEARFATDERRLILAHETTHLKAGDAPVNALACALLCLAWFNPFAHLAARRLRIDQELACDAAVVGRFPEARRRYAELLLKTQIETQALPLGCYWPAKAAHPLKERIAMLKSPLPGRTARTAGLALAAGLALGAGAAAWAAAPGAARTLPDLPTLKPAASLVQPVATPERPLRLVAAERGDVAASATPTVLHPNWTQRPGPQDVARLYPAAAARQGVSGEVLMTCRIGGDGRLDACSILRSRVLGGPDSRDLEMGFGTATLKLGLLFRAAPTSRDGKPVAGGVVRIPVIWQAPGSPPPSVIIMPDWLQRPTGADMAMFYPPAAVASHTEGMATIACTVTEEGLLAGCTVAQETPSGAGFGEAALKLSERFKMKPMSRDGHPVSGGKVRIPIRFALPAAPAT